MCSNDLSETTIEIDSLVATTKESTRDLTEKKGNFSFTFAVVIVVIVNWIIIEYCCALCYQCVRDYLAGLKWKKKYQTEKARTLELEKSSYIIRKDIKKVQEAVESRSEAVTGKKLEQSEGSLYFFVQI